MTPAERQAVREETLLEVYRALASLPVVGIATRPYLDALTACRGVVGDMLTRSRDAIVAARLAAPPATADEQDIAAVRASLAEPGLKPWEEIKAEARLAAPPVPPAPEAPSEAPAVDPIPMVLHCPECRFRHVDTGEFATKVHHTHSCQNCGLTWRPAVVPTVGVQFLPGFKNAEPLGPTRGEQGEDLTACGGCGQHAVVWRHDRPPTPADPCCWMREPGMWVFDCVREREEPAGGVAEVPTCWIEGTPWEGIAHGPCDVHAPQFAQPPPVATEGKREVPAPQVGDEWSHPTLGRLFLEAREVSEWSGKEKWRCRMFRDVTWFWGESFTDGTLTFVRSTPREPGPGGEGTGRL